MVLLKRWTVKSSARLIAAAVDQGGKPHMIAADQPVSNDFVISKWSKNDQNRRSRQILKIGTFRNSSTEGEARSVGRVFSEDHGTCRRLLGRFACDRPTSLDGGGVGNRRHNQRYRNGGNQPQWSTTESFREFTSHERLSHRSRWVNVRYPQAAGPNVLSRNRTDMPPQRKQRIDP
jgi:hypothetical protein